MRDSPSKQLMKIIKTISTANRTYEYLYGSVRKEIILVNLTRLTLNAINQGHDNLETLL